jgi:hypothetical protein
VELTTSLLLLSKLRISGIVPLLPLDVFFFNFHCQKCCGAKPPFHPRLRDLVLIEQRTFLGIYPAEYFVWIEARLSLWSASFMLSRVSGLQEHVADRAKVLKGHG